MRSAVACALILAGCVYGPVSLDGRVAPVHCDNTHTCKGGWALGADIPVLGMQYGQTGPELRAVDKLTIDPPELGEVTRAGLGYTIHTLAAGSAHITGTIAGERDALDVEIVPATLGPVVVDDPLAPAGAKMLAVYAGSPRPIVLTSLVDAIGDPVAGHGPERWGPEDRLTEVPASYFTSSLFVDSVLARQVNVFGDPVAVTNGADTITFVERPLRSAATIDLVNLDGTADLPSTRIIIPHSSGRSFRVLATTADGLPLLGGAGPVEVSFSPAIATATALESTKHLFGVQGTAVGVTTMTVVYDGVTATYSLDVR